MRDIKDMGDIGEVIHKILYFKGSEKKYMNFTYNNSIHSQSFHPISDPFQRMNNPSTDIHSIH